LSVLLGAVSVLIQRQHQLGIARAGQYAVPIQGVFADDVGEAGSGLIAAVCADVLADGMCQSLASAAGYAVVYLHGHGDRFFILPRIVYWLPRRVRQQLPSRRPEGIPSAAEQQLPGAREQEGQAGSRFGTKRGGGGEGSVVSHDR
jgi:hypothetical protein